MCSQQSYEPPKRLEEGEVEDARRPARAEGHHRSIHRQYRHGPDEPCAISGLLQEILCQAEHDEVDEQRVEFLRLQAPAVRGASRAQLSVEEPETATGRVPS